MNTQNYTHTYKRGRANNHKARMHTLKSVCKRIWDNKRNTDNHTSKSIHCIDSTNNLSRTWSTPERILFFFWRFSAFEAAWNDYLSHLWKTDQKQHIRLHTQINHRRQCATSKVSFFLRNFFWSYFPTNKQKIKPKQKGMSKLKIIVEVEKYKSRNWNHKHTRTPFDTLKIQIFRSNSSNQTHHHFEKDNRNRALKMKRSQIVFLKQTK